MLRHHYKCAINTVRVPTYLRVNLFGVLQYADGISHDLYTHVTENILQEREIEREIERERERERRPHGMEHTIMSDKSTAAG